MQAIVLLLFLPLCQAAFVTNTRIEPRQFLQQRTPSFMLRSSSLGNNDYLSSLTPAGNGGTVTTLPTIESLAQAASQALTRPPDTSSSGVAYDLVAQGLDRLYPPTELDARNAKSRTDGYWPFIQGAGSEPPPQYTYGEFDLQFFAELLDDAAHYTMSSTTALASIYTDKVFCDIGSGTGRLVLGAAALHPTLRVSRGIEILEGIHNVAVQTAEQCQAGMTIPNHPDVLPLAPIDLTCGSATEVDLGEVDVFFMFSSCMPPEILQEITQAIGSQCRVGTLIICTEYQLTTERTPTENGGYFQLQLMSQKDGSCSVVGGVSTAYTYKIIESGAANIGDPTSTIAAAHPSMSSSSGLTDTSPLSSTSGLTDTSAAPPTESASKMTSTTHSTSGISYEQVAESLDVLFPSADLPSRNAKSRTDGYWPFMKGADSEAPVEFTYGEFDVLFFAQLLDQASRYMTPPTLEGKVICDVGSGAGRLVLGAAALHPALKLSKGVEILPTIHDLAVEHVANCQGRLPKHNLPLAPIELTCVSISDPSVVNVSDVELFFIASTCMPEHVLVEIAHAIGQQCQVGTIVISTDYELITERTLCEGTGKYFQLEKLSQTDGYCWVVGGVSTAFTYRLIESAA